MEKGNVAQGCKNINKLRTNTVFFLHNNAIKNISANRKTTNGIIVNYILQKIDPNK